MIDVSIQTPNSIPSPEEIDLTSDFREYCVPDNFTGCLYIRDANALPNICLEWYEWYLNGTKHRIMKPAVVFIKTAYGCNEKYEEIYCVEGIRKGNPEYLKKLYKYVKDDPEMCRVVMAEILGQESDPNK